MNRNDIIDLGSLFGGTLCCDIKMHGRKHCTSCGRLQTNRLNVKSFIKTPNVLMVATNRCHNELSGQLMRTHLVKAQALDNEMYIAGNHENVTLISNYIPSGTSLHMGSSRNSRHYKTFFPIVVLLLV